LVLKRDYLILFFIASAILGVSISYSDVYLFHISMLLLVFYFIISLVKNNLTIRKPILPSNYHRLFYFMIAWYLLTIIWSIDRLVSLQYVFYIFCGSLISLTIIYYSTNLQRLNKIFKVISVFIILEVVFCLLEALTPFRLPISPYSNLLPYFGRDYLLEDFTLKASTPTGFQWNPNTMATVLNLALPFLLLHKRLFVKYIGTFTVVFLIVASGSRGNFIATTLILFCFFYLLNKKRAVIFGTLLPVFGLIVFMMINPFLANSTNGKIRDAYNSFTYLKIYLTDFENRDDSLGIRRLLIQNGMDSLGESNGLGIGGGASKLVVSKGIPWIPETYPMHNFWIEILVEGGIIFSLIFAIWYLKSIFDLYKISLTAKNEIKYYSSSLFLAMIGFTVGAISASSTIYVLPMWIMFGLSVATINYYKSYMRNKSTKYVNQEEALS
jgi:teichuronic acid biosynthesis protein TuaE